MSGERCSKLFGHERNKHLLIFQTSKRARELSKKNSLKENSTLFLLMSLALAKKGLMLLQNNLNILQNAVNVYQLPDFEDFCGSKLSNDIKQAFLTDRNTFNEYYDYILI